MFGTLIRPTNVSIPKLSDLIIEGYSDVKSRSITSKYKPGIGSNR